LNRRTLTLSAYVAFFVSLILLLRAIQGFKTGNRDSSVAYGLEPFLTVFVLCSLAAFFTSTREEVSLLSVGIIAFSMFILLSIPALKYSLPYGFFDSLTHFAGITDILASGAIRPESRISVYPTFHVLIAMAMESSGVAPIWAFNYVPPMIYSMIPFFAYFLAKGLFDHREYVRFSVAISFFIPSIGRSYFVTVLPATFSIVLSLALLACIANRTRTPSFAILVVILLPTLSMSHPLTPMVLTAALLVAVLAGWVVSHQTESAGPDELVGRHLRVTLGLAALLGVMTMAWLFLASFDFTGGVIKNISAVFLQYLEATGPAGQTPSIFTYRVPGVFVMLHGEELFLVVGSLGSIGVFIKRSGLESIRQRPDILLLFGWITVNAILYVLWTALPTATLFNADRFLIYGLSLSMLVAAYLYYTLASHRRRDSPKNPSWEMTVLLAVLLATGASLAVMQLYPSEVNVPPQGLVYYNPVNTVPQYYGVTFLGAYVWKQNPNSTFVADGHWRQLARAFVSTRMADSVESYGNSSYPPGSYLVLDDFMQTVTFANLPGIPFGFTPHLPFDVWTELGNEGGIDKFYDNGEVTAYYASSSAIVNV